MHAQQRSVALVFRRLLIKRRDLARAALEPWRVKRFETRHQPRVVQPQRGELRRLVVHLRHAPARAVAVQRLEKRLHLRAALARRLLQIAEPRQRAPRELRRPAVHRIGDRHHAFQKRLQLIEPQSHARVRRLRRNCRIAPHHLGLHLPQRIRIHAEHAHRAPCLSKPQRQPRAHQLRVAGVPDALGELIEKHRQILPQRRRRELLPRVALDGLLHPAQFRDARLEIRHARLHLRPRLRAQRVSIRERRADVHELVRKRHALRERQPPQRLHHRQPVRVKMHEPLPVIPLLRLDPARRLEILQRRPRPLAHRRHAIPRMPLHLALDDRQRILALHPARRIRRRPLQRIERIHIQPRILYTQHPEKLRPHLAKEGGGKSAHAAPPLAAAMADSSFLQK